MASGSGDTANPHVPPSSASASSYVGPPAPRPQRKASGGGKPKTSILKPAAAAERAERAERAAASVAQAVAAQQSTPEDSHSEGAAVVAAEAEYGYDAGGYEYVSRQIETLSDGSTSFGPQDFTEPEGQMGSFCGIFASPLSESVKVSAVSGAFFFKPGGPKDEHVFWASVFRVGGTGDAPKAMLVDRSPFKVYASEGVRDSAPFFHSPSSFPFPCSCRS